MNDTAISYQKAYEVHVHRGEKAGKVYHCKTLRAAMNLVDRLDNAYGACCATAKRIS